jgi:large subunit ribosomal protein L9
VVKVVFLEEVEGSGNIGEVRNVADGFARNYLLPRRLAVPATEHNIRIAEARAQVEMKRQAKLDSETQVLVERMVGKSITLTVKAGPQGRLYGSVTSRDIAEELGKLIHAEVEHRQRAVPKVERQHRGDSLAVAGQHRNDLVVGHHGEVVPQRPEDVWNGGLVGLVARHSCMSAGLGMRA